ncbi:histidine kinase [Streptomyces filamentosus]|uniref:histidine kinase n=2 Tax=Streptomyces filamentosus TaxID=67294 RepID=A0ABY4V608_STRFL|nr:MULTISPECIES: histidine kinase [Streptomyces]ESU51942.1 putative two-component system sensor kinase [Streptomyces sp. HCCB10043]MYR77216.1 two-component sensor histidine kinase [Streptomyces sp. SID5466]USC51108.1 histidine kinase [Streptomyces filamentosus]
MHRILTPLTSAVTYSRWLHMFIPAAACSVWFFISDMYWMLALFAVPVGLVPAMRLQEGLQAQLLLTPSERGQPDASIAVVPAVSWAERWRTVLWLEVRLLISAATLMALWLPVASIELVLSAAGRAPEGLVEGMSPHWWNALLAPLPIVPLLVLVVLGGRLTTAAARWLLGPSPTDRLSVLEELTEELLERNRIARELHDSIGHALTVAVVQAGAARAANDPAFTERALAAIEETGRDALEDLERVLRVLRESGTPVSRRPTLAEAKRLLDSATGSGAKVVTRVSGDLALVPAPVSREGYRILQESLTNVLRHAGPVPIRVSITVADGRLELGVTNPMSGAAGPPGSGSGLRGMRERAALLGGKARMESREGEWRVRVSLPLDGIRWSDALHRSSGR